MKLIRTRLKLCNSKHSIVSIHTIDITFDSSATPVSMIIILCIYGTYAIYVYVVGTVDMPHCSLLLLTICLGVVSSDFCVCLGNQFRKLYAV